MENPEFPSESLHERTIMAVRQLLERTQGQLAGLGGAAVNQGVQMLFPRLQQRIRNASEDKLRVELQNLQYLLGAVLRQPPAAAAPKHKKREKQPSRVKRQQQRKRPRV